jgi:hypothetical protein
LKETRFWNMINSGLPEVHWSRIESPSSAPGTFDVNGCWAGIEVWIELKTGHSRIRPSQRAWGMARHRAGGNLYIVCLTDKRIELWSYESAVIKQRYPHKCELSWKTPMTNWSALRSALFNAALVKERINDTKRYSTFGV